MSRPCSVCRHPDREAINHATVTGTPFRKMAERFGTPVTNLFRHRTHIPRILAKAEEAREVAAAGTILERLQKAHAEAWEILAEGRRDGDQETRLKALARIEKQLELEGKLIGELQSVSVVNFSISPDWLRVRGVLLEALDPFPEAGAAVSAALRRLDAPRS